MKPGSLANPYSKFVDERMRLAWWVEYNDGYEGVLWAVHKAAADSDASFEARVRKTSIVTVRPATIAETDTALRRMGKEPQRI